MDSTDRHHPARPRLAAAAIWAGGAAWLTAVGAGLVSMSSYGAEPGAMTTPPARWPTTVPVGLDPVLPTLVLFAHPHCPCTQATLGELERVMARSKGHLVARVLFYTDPRLGPRWERTASWDHAATIPGVHPQVDPMGETARAFGARTSGFTALYAPDGRLLFHGGITASRGHEGDNAGAAAIIDLAAGGTASVRSTAVYGCEIVGPEPEGRSR
ncbi:MAG TPA: hypothetical protein VFD82_15155 [Planctomycetota bacterium]|nr:hypothetical protein [Planctomycetota bacterium]